MKTVPVAKRREIGARTWELPVPHVSPRCHQATSSSRRPQCTERRDSHTGRGSSPDLESKINTSAEGQGGKQLSNDGSRGPRASPAALRWHSDTSLLLSQQHSCQDTLGDPQGWPDQSQVCFCHTNAVGSLQEKQDNALGFLLHGRPERAAHPELCENS